MRAFVPETGTGTYMIRQSVAILCSLLLLPGEGLLHAQTPVSQAAPATPGAPAGEPAAKLPPEVLDSLVAPIALYPDPLLSQSLVASTYPLEIIQLQQWMEQNKGLKDKALADAVAKQNWDPSIQSLAALPDVVKRLSENIKWTADLGNAFLAQQSEVMDAVQRMRQKASGTGNLKSTEQMKVETRVVENKTVIVVEQANPQVVYVPSYDPVVVYGAPAYPYPAVAYPVGYAVAGMALSFGVGVAMGAMWGGGWGYNAGWGGNNNININNNNNFVRNSSGNRVNQRDRQGNNWQHNPQHRGGAPYGDRATANKFGGTTRGDAASRRQAGGEPGGASAGTLPSNRGGGGGGFGGSRGGGDRVGDRQVSSGARSGDRSAFGGSSGRSSGGGARASSSRGSSSMGGSRGGGSRGGGGGRRR